MSISFERLNALAGETGFRAEILEKVIILTDLLNGFRSHPYLKDRLALKGGTALNLFIFDLPRLSVDIDLNYIGAVSREDMLRERPEVERAMTAVCERDGLTVQRVPSDHAGGKWRLRYDSATGQGGNLEIDINFLFRVPLWPVTILDSNEFGTYRAERIPVFDLHELTAGKLAALLSRSTSRDLFDVYQLLTQVEFDPGKLRLAFVLYGGMNRKDWRTVSPDDVAIDERELRSNLLPVLRREFLEKIDDPAVWVDTLMERCRQELEIVLPLTEAEMHFLDTLLDHGKINPSILTPDGELAERILNHPWLLWKAINVRQHKGN